MFLCVSMCLVGFWKHAGVKAPCCDCSATRERKTLLQLRRGKLVFLLVVDAVQYALTQHRFLICVVQLAAKRTLLHCICGVCLESVQWFLCICCARLLTDSCVQLC